MAARKTDMQRVQELVRLHRLGESTRDIAKRLRMGRDTIRAHLDALRAAGLLDGPPDALPEGDVLRAVLGEHLAVPKSTPPTSTITPWKDELTRMRAAGAGPKAIHDWLRVNKPDFDGSLSAVKRICARLTKAEGPKPTAIAIPVTTAPGEVAQVDFVYVGKVFDPVHGAMALGLDQAPSCG